MGKNERTGLTEIKSVSVSVEFGSLLEKFNISPTEAFRKGMALELYERGVPQYQTDTNRERHKNIQGILESLKRRVGIIKEIEKQKRIIHQIEKLIE